MKCLSVNFIPLNLLIVFILKCEIVEAIVGGFTSDISNKHKYTVSVQANGEHVCGGAILADKYILTAANCVVDFDGKFKNKKFSVVPGTYDIKSTTHHILRRIFVAFVYIPPSLNFKQRTSETLHYNDQADIAVLKLQEDIDLDSNVGLTKLNLPVRGPSKYPSYFGTNPIITGFGIDYVRSARRHGNVENSQSSSLTCYKLKFAETVVLHKTACNNIFTFTLNDAQLCARIIQFDKSNPAGACEGDIGDPLVLDEDTIIGVLVQNPQSCNEQDKASLYTRVSSYNAFIKKAMFDKKNGLRIGVSTHQVYGNNELFLVELK